MITNYNLYENINSVNVINLQDEINKCLRYGGGYFALDQYLTNLLQGKYCIFTYYKGDKMSGVIEEVKGGGGIKFRVNGEWIPINNYEPVIIDDAPTKKIRWYKGGKLTQENKLNEGVEFSAVNQIQESNNGQLYQIGDEVIINSNIKGDIIKYDWPRSMNKLIGITGTIKKKYYGLDLDELNRHAYQVEVNRDNYRIYEESLDPVDKPYSSKIRWYKGGKLTQENIDTNSEIEEIIKVRKKLTFYGISKLDEIQRELQGIFIGKLCEFRKINNEMTREVVDDVQVFPSTTFTNAMYFTTESGMIQVDITTPVIIFKSEEEPKPRIRWYKHGKLSESASKYTRFIIDSDWSVKHLQDLMKGKICLLQLDNKFVEVLIEDVGKSAHYTIVFKINGKWTSSVNTDRTISVLNTENNVESKVRWYKKGKLQKFEENAHHGDEIIYNIDGFFDEIRDDNNINNKEDALAILSNIFVDNHCTFRAFRALGELVSIEAIVNECDINMFEVLFRVDDTWYVVDTDFNIKVSKGYSPKIRWYKHGKFNK